MLSRKTLGVAGAAMLGTMALMATNVANAVIKAGGTEAVGSTYGNVMFAKEDLLGTEAGTHTEDGVKYYIVTNAGNALDIQAATALAPSASLPTYLRFELENMVFGAQVAGVASGGGPGQNFAVVQYTSGDANANRILAPTTIGVLPDMSGSVSVTEHVNALHALEGTNPLGNPQMAENAVRVVDGIVETGMSSMSVAEVETGFTKFVSGTGGAASDTVAAIGMLEIETAASVLDQLGVAVDSPDDVLGATTPITITYKGDFSGEEDGLTYSLYNGMDCGTAETPATAVPASVNDDETEMTPDAQPDGTGSVMHYLCVTVGADSTAVLPNTAFTATVKYTAVADAAFPRMEMTETVGSIGRNGTSYHIPYLTTHEAYRQRVVIVNRGAATTYSFGNFQSDDDAMPEPGGMAMGDLPMGQKVLRSTDIVSGVTRAAATLSIVASRDNISAAIQQVTLGNAVVDTVYLEAEEN